MHARRIETPAARATDPRSSHDAADQHTASGKRAFQQCMAAAAVERHPGCTSLELSKKTGIDRYVLARRLPECVTAETVRKGPPRKCTASEKDVESITWWPPSQPIQLELVR